jgi:hypothetical protein
MVGKQWGWGAIAAGLVLATPVAAEAARLSVDGKVQLENTAEPLEQARVTVTFHGHELGIHEYTTRRTLRVSTDADGEFTMAKFVFVTGGVVSSIGKGIAAASLGRCSNREATPSPF